MIGYWTISLMNSQSATSHRPTITASHGTHIGLFASREWSYAEFSPKTHSLTTLAVPDTDIAVDTDR